LLARAKRVGISSLHKQRCVWLTPIPTFPLSGEGEESGLRIPKKQMAGTSPAIATSDLRDAYFFAGGAILLSAGFGASLAASAASGLSRRSTLAASRSLAT
jgi:hypothetical protein